MIQYGIYIADQSSKIASNQFSDILGRGIILNGADNAVTGNTIENCGQGIVAGGTNNIFYHNNFIGNRSHVGGTGNNHWYYEGKGNFWSDYNGTDTNGDGVGDTPYQSGPHALDNYPLMEPYGQ